MLSAILLVAAIVIDAAFYWLLLGRVRRLERAVEAMQAPDEEDDDPADYWKRGPRDDEP